RKAEKERTEWRESAKTRTGREGAQVRGQGVETCEIGSKQVKTSGNEWKRKKTSIRMVTGEVAPDARKPCAIVHEKRPKLGPTAKRAKSAGKRRKGAQCCGNVSKRAGTNGNVWKHQFGWVPGKSV